MAPVKLVQPRVSYADLQETPEDGRRYELYDGEVFVVPAPIPLHQLAVHQFGDLLKAYAQQHGGLVFLSPIDIVFSEFNVLQPDLVFFVNGREHLIDLRQAIRIVPDIAIEVVSPSSVRTDRGKKILRTRPVRLHKAVNDVARNTLREPTPAGVGPGHHTQPAVGDEQRYAVRRLHRNGP